MYHSSQSSTDPNIPGTKPEDGYAPEWNDGINYRIDYYQGSSSTGRLLRSEIQEYDADVYLADSTKHAKTNVRSKSTTTRYVDDGGVEGVVSRDAWDGFGHWTIEVESGFNVTAPRTTRTLYANGRCGLTDMACSTTASSCPNGESCYPPDIYDTDLLLLKEVSDGTRVLNRDENEYF